MNKRRNFMIATASSLLSGVALAKKPESNVVQESDPSAIALGYVSNIRNIDTKKYPQFRKNTLNLRWGNIVLLAPYSRERQKMQQRHALLLVAVRSPPEGGVVHG